MLRTALRAHPPRQARRSRPKTVTDRAHSADERLKDLAQSKPRCSWAARGIAQVVVEMEPALDMEQLFEDAAALARAGKWMALSRRGIPTGPRAVLDMAHRSLVAQ